MSEITSTRSATTNPGVGGEKINTKGIALAGLSAGLYVVLLIYLAPISFGPIQLRIADCLLPLAAMFGWPLIIGPTIGCVIGNSLGGIFVFGALNPLDIIFGSIANLVATYFIFLGRRHRLVSCIAGSVAIGVIVGGYLWLLFPPPDILGLALPVWAAMVISVTLSSLVAIAIVGYVILAVLSKPAVVEALRSLGLTVHS